MIFSPLNSALTARCTSLSSFSLDVATPAPGGTRLTQVRAVNDKFPLYGDLVTEPAGAWARLRQGPVAVVDPTLLVALDDAHLADPAAHRLYQDHGTTELDALYAPYQVVVNDLARERGYEDDKNFKTRVFEGSGHNEKAWAARLEIPLLFLLGKH